MAHIAWTDSAAAQLGEYLAYLEGQDVDMAGVIKRVNAVMQRLEAFPESSEAYALPLRRLTIRGLSVSCYYIYEDNIVTVLWFRHDRQKPL